MDEDEETEGRMQTGEEEEEEEAKDKGQGKETVFILLIVFWWSHGPLARPMGLIEEMFSDLRIEGATVCEVIEYARDIWSVELSQRCKRHFEKVFWWFKSTALEFIWDKKFLLVARRWMT